MRLLKQFFMVTTFFFVGGVSTAGAQFAKPTNFTPNPIYYGQTGFNTLPGSVKLELQGAVKTPFLSRQVTWARTGKSTNDLKVSGTWGAIKMPSGTQFYAIPFKDGFLSMQKKMTEKGFNQPDVAWCTPEYKPEKGDPICFFTDLSWKESYGTSGAGSAFFPEYLSMSSSSQIYQSPNIKEGPANFGKTLTIEIQIKKIKKKSITLEGQLFDGIERSDIISEKKERVEDGSAVFELWGGTLKIIPIDKKSFEVRQVKPFGTEISLAEEKLIPNWPYSLRVN